MVSDRLLKLKEGVTIPFVVYHATTHESRCTADSASITEATTASTTDGAGDSTATTGSQPPVNRIGEASDQSGDAANPRNDITELTHDEQDGSHSITIHSGGGLAVGDEGVTAVKVVHPSSGDASEWQIEWAITESGSEAIVFGPQPTPRLDVFADRQIISFAKFPDGLPSGTQIDITLCNADATACDSITYTVP